MLKFLNIPFKSIAFWLNLIGVVALSIIWIPIIPHFIAIGINILGSQLLPRWNRKTTDNCASGYIWAFIVYVIIITIQGV